jgi:hypothetical protein
LEIFLVIATILGGIAAAWFFYDKYIISRLKTGENTLDISKALRIKYPNILERAINEYYPTFRLPSILDLKEDWEDSFNRISLEPFFCTGSFLGNKSKCIASFILSDDNKSKIIVFERDKVSGDGIIEIESSISNPQNMYIKKIKKGKYSSHWEKEDLILKFDALAVGTFESAENAKYYDQTLKIFKTYCFSD